MTQRCLAQCIYSVVMSSPQRELMAAMTKHNIDRALEWKTTEMRWAQPPTIDRLHEIQTKTLFIIGTQDMADNLHTAELFQQVPDIRFDRFDEVLLVMNAAKAQPTPAAQIQHIAEGALADVQRQPDVFRFYLNLLSQPNLDPVVAQSSQKLKDEQARQFEVQTEMFAKLGVEHPRVRSLYFSATLQGIMLMFSTYPNETMVLQVYVLTIIPITMLLSF